jgi:hypothetical protein
VDTENLLALIHGNGYWRVLLRPPIFEQARLRDKAHCLSVVHQASVASEGWQYPIVGHAPSDEGPDWVGGGANVMTFIEYWRFYQSGQFVHHIATKEDHMGRLGLFHPQFFVPGEGRKYLAITSTLCMITDIVEFAARLAYRNVLVPSAALQIELHDMAGRQLTYMAPSRRLPGSYWFKEETVQLKQAFKTDDVIGRAAEIAVELTSELFSRAGWAAPGALLIEDQARYTERRRQ